GDQCLQPGPLVVGNVAIDSADLHAEVEVDPRVSHRWLPFSTEACPLGASCLGTYRKLGTPRLKKAHGAPKRQPLAATASDFRGQFFPAIGTACAPSSGRQSHCEPAVE